MIANFRNASFFSKNICVNTLAHVNLEPFKRIYDSDFTDKEIRTVNENKNGKTKPVRSQSVKRQAGILDNIIYLRTRQIVLQRKLQGPKSSC